MNAHNDHAKAAKLLYKNFLEQFVWIGQSRVWKVRQRDEVIGRIIGVNPNEGERYCLRLLLAHVPAPTSFDYLKTVNGTLIGSYSDVAVALGVLETMIVTKSVWKKPAYIECQHHLDNYSAQYLFIAPLQIPNNFS